MKTPQDLFDHITMRLVYLKDFECDSLLGEKTIAYAAGKHTAYAEVLDVLQSWFDCKSRGEK